MRPSVRLHHAGKLFVDAHLNDAGDLVIDGQDLSRSSEYEYTLTVAAQDIPAVIHALGGDPDSDVLPLLAQHSTEIITRGEKTWLESLGLHPHFWSRIGD